MEVTLKKASELARAAQAAAKATEMKKIIVLSAYSDEEPKEAVIEARLAFTKALETSLALNDAAFEIRALIGAANGSAGVDALLTKVAAIDEAIKLVTAADTEEHPIYSSVAVKSNDLEALTKQVLRHRDDALSLDATKRSGSAEISLLIVSDKDHEGLKADISALKRKRTALKDQLTSINFGTRVVLSDEIVGILAAANLID